MRLLAGLGLLTPLALIVLVAGTRLGYFSTLTEEPFHLVLIALGVWLGVSITSMFVWLYLRVWFGRLVSAARRGAP